MTHQHDVSPCCGATLVTFSSMSKVMCHNCRTDYPIDYKTGILNEVKKMSINSMKEFGQWRAVQHRINGEHPRAVHLTIDELKDIILSISEGEGVSTMEDPDLFFRDIFPSGLSIHGTEVFESPRVKYAANQGMQPVGDDVVVDVITRNGEQLSATAIRFKWGIIDEDTDIESWRISEDRVEDLDSDPRITNMAEGLDLGPGTIEEVPYYLRKDRSPTDSDSHKRMIAWLDRNKPESADGAFNLLWHDYEKQTVVMKRIVNDYADKTAGLMAGDAHRKQVGGGHYNSHKIQPWDIIDEYNLDFYLGNVIKYVVRDKGDMSKKIEDLEKAKHYIDKEIELLKG